MLPIKLVQGVPEKGSNTLHVYLRLSGTPCSLEETESYKVNLNVKNTLLNAKF